MVKQYNLDKWLHYLETRTGQEIQLGLTRVMAVAQKMDLQRPNSPVILIAGTNGKGSTLAALETIYHLAGYQVAAYTSPHLMQFNERIRVNLHPISDDDLCQAFSVIEEGRGDILLTYFEMTTLAALWYFKKRQLDIMILEVGLGGRLDATNIIDADLSIITTIDFDHQDFLGATLEEIGREKVGILRQGRPFIYADTNPPLAVIDAANQLAASAYFLGKEFSFEEEKDSWTLYYKGGQMSALPKPKIQLKSAAAAIIACLLLKQYLPLSDSAVHAAMQRLFIPGRLQLCEGIISILYDVAHNPQAAKLLAKTLQKMPKKRKTHAVFAAFKDKDILGLILPLKDSVDYWYPALLTGKRAASADLLFSCFHDAEISIELCYNSPRDAFEGALKQVEAGDLIVVYGSFFTVSQVMAVAKGGFNEVDH